MSSVLGTPEDIQVVGIASDVDPVSMPVEAPQTRRGNEWGNADPVEEALAKAVGDAAAAGRFDVVVQLAKEIEARRLRTADNVIPMRRKKLD